MKAIRITLTDAEQKALLLAIKNMEGEDDVGVNAALDSAEQKIRLGRSRAAGNGGGA